MRYRPVTSRAVAKVIHCLAAAALLGSVWIAASASDLPGPILSVAPLQRLVSATGGITTVAVSNAGGRELDYSAAFSANKWIKIDPPSSCCGTNSGTIEISAYAANQSTGQRSATLVVSATDVDGVQLTSSPVNVTITQAGSGQYVLQLAALPDAGGNVTGSGIFDADTTQTASATAKAGWTFVDWTENGVEVSTSASYTFILGSDRNLLANFTPATQKRETLLHAFAGERDGAQPIGALIRDASGVLYGTTAAGGRANGGTIFELAPPAAGQTAWKRRILYAFSGTGRDGGCPSCVGDPSEDGSGGLTLGRNGELYGAASQGGGSGHGTLFQMLPPDSAGDAWSFKLLYTFRGVEDGDRPTSSLVEDDAGALYGTAALGGLEGAAAGGGVFELVPPKPGGTRWSQRVLYTFNGLAPGSRDGFTPSGGVVFGDDGALYGTTRNGGAHGAGTVYKLTPAAGNGPWSETVIYNFRGGRDGGNPVTTLIRDATGNLYGTTKSGGGAGRGTVFELAAPAEASGQWQFSVLHNFTGGQGRSRDGANPTVGLTMDASGALYGTTWNGGAGHCGTANGCGVVFRLLPPGAGSTRWTEQILYRFRGGRDGATPVGGVTLDDEGNVFGTTSAGGAKGLGTAFELAAPAP